MDNVYDNLRVSGKEVRRYLETGDSIPMLAIERILLKAFKN